MFLTNSARSSTYTAILVDVEPGLIARILNSPGGKDHPQRNGVHFVVHALHARWNQDRDLRAGHHVRASRAAQVLHRFPEKVARLDVWNHHAVGAARHWMLDALRPRRRLQKCAVEGKRPEDVRITELAGFGHPGKQLGIHTRGHRLTDRFGGAHKRDLWTRQSQGTHDLDGVLHDLFFLL